jgi:hypothetical protein
VPGAAAGQGPVGEFFTYLSLAESALLKAAKFSDTCRVWVQNFVQHLVLAAYEHRHNLQEVDDIHTTNIPLLQSK